MGRPLRKLALSQGTEALKTGAVPESQIPIVQRTLEQVLMAGSKARTDAEGRVAAAGIGRTPQGTAILTNQDFMNALQASLVPSTVAQQTIDRGLGVSMGQLGPSLGGLSNVAGSESQVRSSQIGAQAQIISSIMNMLGQSAMGYGFAAG